MTINSVNHRITTSKDQTSDEVIASTLANLKRVYRPEKIKEILALNNYICLLYTSPSPRDS